MIFQAKSFTKIFDNGSQNGPLVITPQNIFQPPIGGWGGVGELGAPLTTPPNSHFIGGLESVKKNILGVPGILAE